MKRNIKERNQQNQNQKKKKKRKMRDINSIMKTKQAMINDMKVYSSQKKKQQITESCSVMDNQTKKVTSIIFHPFEPFLFSIDGRNTIRIWDWTVNPGKSIKKFENGNSGKSRLSFLSLVNEYDSGLIMTGSTDGIVKIWDTFLMNNRDEQPKMVSAWRSFPYLEEKSTSKDSRCVFDWNPDNGFVSVFGENRAIKIWDVNTEIEYQTLPSNCEQRLTSLKHDPQDKNILFGGSYNGRFLVYDLRDKRSTSLKFAFSEHKSRIINICKQKGDENTLITGSSAGVIKFWDFRYPQPVKTLNLHNSLTALEMSDYAPLIASAVKNDNVSILNTNGELMGKIGYYDAFIVQKFGLFYAINFHPYQLYLAATSDSLISVFMPAYLKKN
eukprot:Anaeramoba_ignava/a2915_29.p1 GENE.a2915_29~~a2915_29.p1  ORF type:complete len:384 (-),score=96.22 a2915_29:1362-2513(-)